MINKQIIALKAMIENNPSSKDTLYRKMVEAVRVGSAAMDSGDEFYMLIDDFMGIGMGDEGEGSYGEDMEADTQAYITCLWVDALCSKHAKFQLSNSRRLDAIETLVGITINGL